MALLHTGDRICASCGGMNGKHRPGCIGDDTVEVISVFSRQQAIDDGILREFLFYFLRLGTFGFGGPIALAGHMQKDLVEQRKWVSSQDYVEGLAFAQLSPGPLAAQLAMYLGWVRAGSLGATLTGVAFVLPSFLMVMVLAGLYVHYGRLPWIQGVFYGVGAAVIAIIVRSAYKLVRSTLKRDWLLWALFAALAVTTAWRESEIVWLFLLCGFVSMFIKGPPRLNLTHSAVLAYPGLENLFTGALGPATALTLGTLFLFFLKAGAFVFGSGLAIVPFLYGGVVGEFHWLTERQFLDAVAVAMITPGPVVITAAFIGYLVAGSLGALLACGSIRAPLFHCAPGSTLLPALRAKSAGEGVRARGHRCRRRRDHRSRLHSWQTLAN
ncbi:MAG TPA: chromate efflux transporter [Terriglobales bacterium]|nr:chromate efflux transporter [Terriglobales bacterium]